MRLLVAIADHGTAARHHLDRLLAEYRSMPYDVDLVVLSDVPKELGDDVEVLVGAPAEDPWSLPFAHRPLFIERADEYDLFVYTENDTLITARNIEAYLEITDTLRPDEILGFLRSEADADGELHYPMIHGGFRWLPETFRRRGDLTFAAMTNEHAASYLLTRAQLRRCIASGGYEIDPHEGRHDMLCAAATDPYTRCGLTRVLCLSRLEDFTLPHLSNRYAGVRGVTQRTLDDLVAAVEAVGDDGAWQGPLFDPENGLPTGAWWKDLYEQPRTELLDIVPAGADVLAVGSGWGATEEALADRGHDVTSLPIDPVLGLLVAARGVDVVRAGFDEAARRLAHRRFDCVVLADLLHLVDDPRAVIERFRPLIAPGGSLVISVPNVWWPTQLRRLRRRGPRTQGFARSGVHATHRRTVSRWLSSSPLEVVETRSLPGRGPHLGPLEAMTGAVLSAGFVVRAELRTVAAPAADASLSAS
ncbi:MAG: class I SAM-dependent methyltransferase [Actinomycetota bacterium]